MTFPARLILSAVICVIASAASFGPATAQLNRDSTRTSYMAVLDDSCKGYRVALAYPRAEHDKIKAAVKAEGAAGPYAEIAKQFEQNTKVVGVAGACQDAFKKLETDLDFGDQDHHGADGPIRARRFPRAEWLPDQVAFHQACLDAGFADVPPVVRLERNAFYERARQAFGVVMTSDTAQYANLILKKGVTGLARR